LLGDDTKLAQNDFRKAVEDLALREQERKARGDGGEGSRAREKEENESKRRAANSGPLDLALIRTDFNKLHPLIFWAFKDVLKEWEEALDARPEDEKRTAAGKLESGNHAQSAQNLKPLFRGLRNRVSVMSGFSARGATGLPDAGDEGWVRCGHKCWNRVHFHSDRLVKAGVTAASLVLFLCWRL
jgi:hypothetical protein